MRQTTQFGRLTGMALVASTAVIGLGILRADPAVTWPTQGWPKGAPADVGLDERKLADFDADLAAGKYALVDSFQVFRCGREVSSANTPRLSKIYADEAKTKDP